MEKMKCKKCGSQLSCSKFGSGTISVKDEREHNFPELFEKYTCTNPDCLHYLKELTIFGELKLKK